MTIRNVIQQAEDAQDFDDLMQRLRAGDSRASDLVWQRFVGRLLIVADRHLDHAIRPKVDADDIVQSAYCSFFVRFREGRFDLANWSSMWGLLARITVRKCLRNAERYNSQQRDVRREVRLSPCDAVSGTWGRRGAIASPEERTITSEIIEQLSSELPRPYKLVVHRLFAGWSVAEISPHIGRSEDRVRRVVQYVRRRLLEMAARD